MEAHESDEGSLTGPENDLSEEDDDSRLSNNSRGDIKPALDPEFVARLKEHGMQFGQEDLERLPFFFPNPHLMASQLAAAAAAAKVKDMADLRERSPLRGYTDETLPTNVPHSDSSSSTSSQQTWSFEEQFKQLYELSDDNKRKEFLDELFSFMQKRGTPINRLPIMAKQVLDLYELYNLVIARGGLVDVINKKLWQEIIKGLHLPSSITSAAFTLRTQYMKYLYPYECDKRRLSTPAELQAAIDGNRREGRRASYGPYPDMISPLSLVGGRPQMNGNGTSHPLHSTSPNSPPNPGSTPINRDALAALELSRLTLWNLYGGGAALPDPKVPPQQEALNLEVPTRNNSSDGVHTPKIPPPSLPNHIDSSPSPKSNKSIYSHSEKENGKRNDHHNHHQHINSTGPPAPKRQALDEADVIPRGVGMNGTHIKINSRGDGRGNDNSLVVSMEINGIMYQGILFAQSQNATTRVQ